MSANEDMDIARLCALTEVTTRLKPKQHATQAEVRALAREVMRLRVTIRSARLQAQRISAECETSLINAPIAGEGKAL